MGSADGAPHFFCIRFRSEPESRTESYPQVIVGSIIEIHLIAGFRSKSEGSKESFNAAAGVQGEVGGPTAKLVECIVKRLSRHGIGGGVAEFSEAHLPGNECAKWSGCAELELGSEESGDGACSAGDRGAGYAGG